jgi:NADPH:quinone reductase-like Zn-dependent oxidoreductase
MFSTKRLGRSYQRVAACQSSTVFPLLSAADAHRRMEAGDHIGKILLKGC